MIDINQLPDYVLDALQNPTLQKSEKFLVWLEESEERKVLFQDLCDCQEAARRLLPENNPNVDLQWERVKNLHLKKKENSDRKKHIQAFLVIGISIAASFILVFLIGNYLYDAKTEKHPEITMNELSSISPEKRDSEVIIKAKENTSPVLLLTEKGNTTPIYKKILDYTQDTTITNVEKLTLTTPRGKSIKVCLKDGTEIWLNDESRLVYPSHFIGLTRTVELEGEAYFKVAHDENHPFIVKHDGVLTQALGTEFNIRTYENETKHITLVEGSVLISDTLSGQKTVLFPKQDAEYNSSSTMTIKEVNTHKFTAWTEDLFYFEQTELQDIMQTLGRWYNITVTIEDKEAKHYHFTFWAERTGSLKEALALLNQIGTVKAYLNEEKNQVVIKKR